MKKSQCTEEQILGILKQVEGGRTIADVCREHGISDATYHRWKGKAVMMGRRVATAPANATAGRTIANAPFGSVRLTGSLWA